MSSTAEPSRLRAKFRSAARTSMKTGSKSAIVRAMVARSRRTSATADGPQIAALAPKAIQVRLCGAASSGIRQLC